ncbi:MAG: SpoIIE family protein phosphatase [Planctomycetota bacterium]
MTIRTKLFLTLLLFSMVPLLVVALVGRGNWSAVRSDLASSTSDRITTIASETRRHLVEKHAALLERNSALIRLDVEASAEALSQLDRVGPGAVWSDRQLFTAEDFDDPSRGPTDLIVDPMAVRIEADGTETPLLISLEHPAFVIPEGSTLDSLRTEAETLRALVPTFRSLRDDDERLVSPVTQYVALEDSGLHMSWPGKGGYPDDFEPQLRPWYQAGATSLTSTTWTPPVVDAPTGQIRLTCSAPVYRDDGSLLGVVAADVRMIDVLEDLALPESFEDVSQAMIIQLSPGRPGQPPIPEILVSSGYSEERGKSWASAIELKRFEADAPDSNATLGAAMMEQEAGSIDLDIEGSPWVWTWQRLSAGSTYVLIGISHAAADAAATEVVSRINGGIGSTLRQGLAVIGVVIIGVVIVGLWGARSISQPVQTLALTAQAIADGNLDARAIVSTGDELQSLADSFNSMVPKLEERARVLESLGIAREVQQQLLPKKAPHVPGLDIAALCVYSDETGGDYFDFFPVNCQGNERQAVVLGDVTGHGIGAALLMTTARALIHATASDTDDIPRVLNAVNAKLTDDSQSGRFMTLFYLLLTPGSRRADWVSAGHDAAIVLDLASGGFSELAGHDIPLGIDGGWSYTSEAGELPDRFIAVIGTDGIWETREPGGEMFGKDRLRDVMLAERDGSADDIAQRILHEVVRFRGDGPQADDITLIVLRSDEA